VACLWIGDAESGTNLIWPAGYWASDEPLAIHGADGRELARVGQLVTLAGSPGDTGDGAGAMGYSPLDRQWIVTEVLAAVENLVEIPYGRCGDPARAVLRQAEEEARSTGHLYLGTEHVLLALIGDQAGGAGRVLAALSVEQAAMRRRIDEVVTVRPDPPASPRTDLVITQPVRVLLGLAIQRADAAGREEVATEDLLLALSMGQGSIGPAVLRERDVTPERLLQEIRREGR
jgi:hypothetical protein